MHRDGLSAEKHREVVGVALATGQILQVICHFLQGSNEALMVSFWRVAELSEPNVYAALAQAFQFEMMSGAGVHANVIASNAASTRVVINNMTLPLEGGEWVGSIPGAILGDPAPSFVALRVKQIVEDKRTRSGYKRIPFVGEGSFVGNNVTVAAGTKSAIEDFYGLEGEFNYSSGEFGDISAKLQPVVVGRTKDPITGIYELDLDKVNNVVAGSLLFAASQVSRRA